MALCDLSTNCSFFNEEHPDTLYSKELCSEYCENHFSECVRHQMTLSLGIDNVPNNLSPDSFLSTKCACGV